MQPWENLGRALAPDGTEIVLARRGSEWVVRAAGQVLMSSRTHGSEESLALRALERVKAPPKVVLIGGLGFGFTLRAALDKLPRESEVRVAELLPELVTWHREHVGELAGRPLADPRVRVQVGDVADRIAECTAALDVLLLDVDNGPTALAQAKNHRLYSDAGARACFKALVPGGVLALWSAGRDAAYAARLERAGFGVDVENVAARPGSGATHVLFLATRALRAR